MYVSTNKGLVGEMFRRRGRDTERDEEEKGGENYVEKRKEKIREKI